jgi:hypothetical protein
MRRNRVSQGTSTAVVLLTLALPLTSAQADPITIAGYTVTDLGAGTPTFSTAGNGNGVLNAPDGQVYAFSQTPNTALTPGQGIMASFPQLEPPPHDPSEDYGNPLYDYSRVTSAIMNSSGLVAAINDAGISGHTYTENEYLIQRNPDGTWGLPVLAYSSGVLFQGFSGGFNIVGLSKTNEILIQNDSTSNLNQALVYNLNTHTLTDLFSLLASAGLIYPGLTASAIDDNGQILLSAYPYPPSPGNQPTNLLLTPDGLSAAPLEVPAPEPGALAVGLLAIAGFAAHRLREHRSRTLKNAC